MAGMSVAVVGSRKFVHMYAEGAWMVVDWHQFYRGQKAKFATTQLCRKYRVRRWWS